MVAVTRGVNDLPNRPKKTLPKYDLDKIASPEDHIKIFMLTIHLMKVQYEDVVCHLFPYTFVEKASTWYFNL